MDLFLHTFFNPAVVERYFGAILAGALVTIKVAIGVIIAGIALGLLLAVIRSFRFWPASLLIVIFVDIFRALPPLLVIIFVFYGLPNVGIVLSGFVVLWLVLTLILAAFAEEIFWAGISAVPAGHWDAGASTGLSRLHVLLLIVLPQAVRLGIPPLTNRTIAITKNTALGSIIGVPEILGAASSAQAFSGNATPLIMGAVAYVLIFLPLVILARLLEKRFAWKVV